jgi:hypothetical protein
VLVEIFTTLVVVSALNSAAGSMALIAFSIVLAQAPQAISGTVNSIVMIHTENNCPFILLRKVAELDGGGSDWRAMDWMGRAVVVIGAMHNRGSARGLSRLFRLWG